MKKSKQNNSQRRKILWVSFLILDVHLHKTSQLEILTSLAKRGYNTGLIAVHSQRKFKIENPHVRIVSIPLRYIPIVSPVMFAIFLFFSLPLYIIVSKPDFIITEPDISILSFTSAIPFSKLKKVKLVLDIRSVPVETKGLRGFLKTFWFTASVIIAKKLFDGITIITPMMKEEICKRFDINTRQVGVWSSGVSTTIFNPNSYLFEGEKLRRKLRLSKKFIILYHGALTANRGITETIEAINLIKSDYPDVVLFLLGEGPIVNNLKSLVKMRGLQDNVVIHNPVDYMKVPKYIAMSDVGIVPLPDHEYWRFQSPLKLLEYLAMEKTAIITDIPAHRFIIGENRCGIYILSVKPSEIAKAIVYTYHNKSKLAEWGRCGRIIINEKYTWDKVAERLENYLLSTQ